MYVQKSFLSNATFANNTPGVTAKLGELSSYSATFSQEKGVYTDKTNAPNLILTSFLSKDDATAIAIPAAIAQQTLQICNFIYGQTLGGQTGLTAAVLLENLLTQFTGQANNFVSGNMVTDGPYTLPEWVSWTTTVDATRPNNYIKVWFVDSSFQLQYDETEIVVVPPLTPLDNFFQTGDKVQTLVNALTSSAAMNNIQQAKNGYPETIVSTYTFNYIDPLNSAHTIPTDWSVLIYGPIGNNVDSIKDALMAYILANSTHPRADWVGIFPDIFKRTEFIITPLWNQFAIPNRELSTGIYSPQISYATAASTMAQYAQDYPTPHIDANMTMMSHPYRSLALLAVGSPDNRNAVYQLNQMFTDWIAVTSTSVDFNRMSQTTQDWAFMIEKMLVAAESMGEFTTIPVGMMKIERNGYLYLSQIYNNVNYLILAKTSMDGTA